MKTTLFRVAFNCSYLYKTQWGLFILFLDFSDDELDEMIKCRPFDAKEEYNDESAHAVSPAYYA